MLNAFFRLSDYLHYLIIAKGGKNIHAAFVSGFYFQILNSKERHILFDFIETIRRKMIKSKTTIDFQDYGSGNRSGNRFVSEIAASTAKSAKYARVLYRILESQKPAYAIELGTGSGISTLYQACALGTENPIHTIEGSAKLSAIAAFNAQQCGLDTNIVFHTGSFESVLPPLLAQLPQIDYAFIDGNHRRDATIKYFHLIKEKCHPNSIMVFDDINWSTEMKDAWAYIKNQPDVSCTIDIFALGIVFFNKNIQNEKEHFTLRY